MKECNCDVTLPDTILLGQHDFGCAIYEEDGICERCGGDDVKCLEDCTIHKCIDCGHIEGYQEYSTLKDTVDSSGG